MTFAAITGCVLLIWETWRQTTPLSHAKPPFVFNLYPVISFPFARRISNSMPKEGEENTFLLRRTGGPSGSQQSGHHLACFSSLRVSFPESNVLLSSLLLSSRKPRPYVESRATINEIWSRKIRWNDGETSPLSLESREKVPFQLQIRRSFHQRFDSRSRGVYPERCAGFRSEEGRMEVRPGDGDKTRGTHVCRFAASEVAISGCVLLQQSRIITELDWVNQTLLSLIKK